MLVSLSGVQVDTRSGYDCVSQSAMPNHIAPFSSKWYERDSGFVAGGSLGTVTS